jgi:hypothetical protein
MRTAVKYFMFIVKPESDYQRENYIRSYDGPPSGGSSVAGFRGSNAVWLWRYGESFRAVLRCDGLNLTLSK